MAATVLKLIVLAVLTIAVAACATTSNHPHEDNPHKNSSYTVRGHNRTFAVYNNEHRLISHPIEDLLTEMKWRKATGKNGITDIYVVSHGWNYTVQTSVANYNSYMQLVDEFYTQHCTKSVGSDAKSAPDPCKNFQPYFIFITWTSTARPLTDVANAVLPFGMDDGVRPLTSFIDKVPLHLVTAWKESLNATQNALGSKLPNEYLNQKWIDSTYGYQDSNLIEDSDSVMGEDTPVSALLYKLIQMKKPDLTGQQQYKKTGNDCNQPDPFDPKSDPCVPLDNTKIHLTGHSYGAKLIALAGMESIRRWMLNELTEPSLPIQCPDERPESVANNSANQTNSKKLSRLERALADLNDSIWQKTGHSSDLDKSTAPDCLKKLYNDDNQIIPIDSLSLFNPAFLPGELSYPVKLKPPLLLKLKAPIDTLRFIPRKAIIYTNTDYANGALFSLRDMVINSELSQDYQSLNNGYGSDSEVVLSQSDWLRKTMLYIPIKTYQSILGVSALGVALAFGPVFYGVENLYNLPADFWHHIHTHKLFGGSIDPNSDLSIIQAVGYLGNTVDFFVPPIFEREENQQGFFRLNRPGLGKTGLNNLTEGRIPEINLSGLAPYYTKQTPFGEDKPQCKDSPKECEHPFARDIDPETFRKFASTEPSFAEFEDTERKDAETNEENCKNKELLYLREKFFSFDASQVYDTKWDPIAGAHSDLRETKPPERNPSCCDSSPQPNNCSSCESLDKRNYTFNFLLRFTKTNFETYLKQLESEKISPN